MEQTVDLDIRYRDEAEVLAAPFKSVSRIKTDNISSLGDIFPINSENMAVNMTYVTIRLQLQIITARFLI